MGLLTPAAELAPTCNTARRIFWGWCSGLFAFQIVLAGILVFVDAPVLGGLIAILALEYLFMPAGLVQVALAMREGKLRQTAAIAGGQVVGANLMSVAPAVIWPAAIVLVLPRILAAPIWLIAVRHLRPWNADHDQGRAPLKPFLSYGWAVLGVELVKVMRFQADKLIIGVMMGPEMLGLYFMAFNAGLSLASSFSQAFSVVLFPHLCTSDNRVDALRQGITMAMCLITPVVLLQATLAPIYVPILFGPGWDEISDVVATLCLATIPALLWTASAGWLRVRNRPDIELAVTFVLAVALMINTAVLAPWGLSAVANGYLTICVVVMTGASLPAIAEAFGRKQVRT